MPVLKIENIEHDSEECQRFLHIWSTDIDQVFPDFSIHEIDFATIYLLIVNNEPAGLFVYQSKGEELHIDVDYLIPKYRYQEVGKNFFDEKMQDFVKNGFEVVVAASDNKKHQEYLKSVGFTTSKRHPSLFELNLT
jgi:hypothetical protein